MTEYKKGARPSSPTTPRSKGDRRNTILVLVCSLLIVAAMFYAWGQTIQADHAEQVRHEKVVDHAIIN